MPFTYDVLLLSLLLVSALCLDALVAAFGYGANKIKIPFRSVLVINLICSAFLAAPLFAGKAICGFLSPAACKYICFSLLLLIGLIKLCDSLIKGCIRKKKAIGKSIKFKFLSLKFILYIYADPETADVDESKSISEKEAAVLAVSLSLDGFAVGFGAALFGFNVWAVILFTLIASGLALWLGCILGNRVAKNLRFNISWVAGVILIGLAFMQLI